MNGALGDTPYDKKLEMYKKRCAEALQQKTQERNRCEVDLAYFLKKSWPSIESCKYVHGFHIDAMAEHLMAVSSGEIKRLLINIPPRTSKTDCVSIAWPAWTWAQKEIMDLTGPQVQFLCASYGHTLSLDISSKCRRLIESDWYQKYWGDRFDLRADQNAKTRFDNTASGSRIATSVSSALTGLGGDIILCLPYESMLLSDSGWLPIGDIVENKLSAKIAGWDGQNIVWQEIEKYEKNPFRQFYEVDFGDGKICCTEDHPIYTSRGYIPAKDIVSGDEIWSYDLETVLRVRKNDVQKSERTRKILLSPMQYDCKNKKCIDRQQQTVCPLWDKSLSTSWSYEKTKRGRDFLQQGLFWKKIYGRKKSGICGWFKNKMQTLWGHIYSSQSKKYVLLKEMFWYRQPIFVSQKLRLLQKSFRAKQREFVTLFPRMCGYSPFAAYEGIRERQICSRSSKQKVSSRMECQSYQNYNTKRWQPMHVVWHEQGKSQEGTACSSYRLCEGEYRRNEPDNSMQILPWSDAWRDRAKKNLVKKIVKSSQPISRKEEFTYNIRVNPCHNYFADGILVHNCDDVQNAQEMESELTMKSTVQWFSESLQSRLNNPKTGAIVVIMQRLADSDVAGYILSKESGYVHLNLPLEYDSTRHCTTSIGWSDPRTEDGELLCPDRIGPYEVEKLKKDLGSFAFSAQYQQSPTPRGGGIIKDKWWKMYPEYQEIMDEYGKPVVPLEYPTMDFVIAFADTAYTTKEENDYSALTIWGVWRKDGAPKVMLMAAWQERLELNDLVNKIRESCTKPKGILVDRLLIENKASGKSVAQEIIRLFEGSEFGVELVEPKGDKVSRMYTVQHLFENGVVYAPDRAWAQMVIDQVSKFPRGAFDDLSDTVSGSLNYLRNSGFALRADEYDSAELEGRMLTKQSTPLYDI